MISRVPVALAALSLAAGLSAQPRTEDPAKRGLKPGDLPRIVKITETIYGYEGIHNAGMPTVSLIVIGTDGVLIADGQGSPDNTQKMLDAIAKVTTKPIAEVKRLHTLGLSPEDARKQANWGPYKDWMLADQQDLTAIRKVYEEIEGKLPR